MTQAISDRKPDVLLELGNRTDLDPVGAGVSRLDKWFRDSYIELAMNVPLETLEITSFDEFIQATDIYRLPSDGRLPKCITVILSGDILGANSTVITLDYKDVAYIRQMTAQTQGPPACYTMYGNQIIVRPIPDKTYNVVYDYWQLPNIFTPVSATPLLVPDDWLEIIDMGALMRGFRALLERDKARELQELLYGFKTPAGKQVPGYITYRQTQQQAGSEFENYGLQPRIRRYIA